MFAYTQLLFRQWDGTVPESVPYDLYVVFGYHGHVKKSTWLI